jgi:hypothetical protein
VPPAHDAGGGNGRVRSPRPPARPDQAVAVQHGGDGTPTRPLAPQIATPQDPQQLARPPRWVPHPEPTERRDQLRRRRGGRVVRPARSFGQALQPGPGGSLPPLISRLPAHPVSAAELGEAPAIAAGILDELATLVHGQHLPPRHRTPPAGARSLPEVLPMSPD